MANSKRGEVSVELDGDEYTLVFDYNAISDLEEQFGDDKSVEQLLFRGEDIMPSRRILREAIRVGLEKHHRKHTSKQVGKMIGATIEKDPEAFAKLYEAVVRGIMAAHGMNFDDVLEENKSKEVKDNPDPS